MDTSAFQTGYVLGQVLMMVAVIGVLIFAIIAIVKSFTRKTAGWIITAVFAALLALGLIGTGAALVLGNLAGFLKEGGKLDNKLTSKDGRSSLTVPHSWKAMPELNREADIVGGNIFTIQFAMVITENKEDLGMDLAAFSKLTTEGIAEKMTGSKVGEFQQLTISGHPALRRRIQGTTENLQLSYMHTSVDTGDALTQIMCWTQTGKETTAFPTFEKITATFTRGTTPARTDLSQKTPADRIRYIAAEQLGLDVAKVTPASHITTDLGADELDHVELVMAIEEEFDISISDEVAEGWHRIEDIIRHVEKTASAPPAKAP